MHTLLDAGQIQGILGELADKIAADSTFQADYSMALVGIRSRGELLAQRLAAELSKRRGGGAIDVGALDITMYRDDLATRKVITIPQGTVMNFRLDGRPIILVDDVLGTGRSARAALDALVDFGRPKLIRMAVLIDRGGREYPIKADWVGMDQQKTQAKQKIVVRLKPTDAEDAVYVES